MTFEFIIRDIVTKEDYRVIKKVPEERYESTKANFEEAINRMEENNKKATWTRFTKVLLINKCDDEGNFEEVIQ